MLLAAFGCRREETAAYVSSDQVQALSKELQKDIRQHLSKLCGTPQQPKLLGQDPPDSLRLQRGAAIYKARCVACHGVSGDGNGLAAKHMYPLPRDYRRGIFKFSSTVYGAKPLRQDLLRTIRDGVKGTSMPSFGLLPDDDQEAVLDYVLSLTHRGELELLLALEAESEDEIDPAVVPDLAKEVLGNWRTAREQIVWPQTPLLPATPETVAAGKKAFLSEIAGCYKCHGNDGRGLTTENLKGFQDVWGHSTRAADLTSGMFHGGGRPEDIYRRIHAGISGTPMPSFKEKLADKPETFWHLVHYVQHVSSARRRAVMAENKRRLPAKRRTAAKGGQ